MISSQSKIKDIAWRVLRFVMSKEYALQGIMHETAFLGDFMTYQDKDTISVYQKNDKY